MNETQSPPLSSSLTTTQADLGYWRKVARLVLLSRAMDQLEVEHLTPQGKVKYQFSAGGHELAQILLGLELTHPHDAATAYYRSRPLMLASGLTAAEALAAGMARKGSPSEGRDVGVVFNLPHRSGATILPASGDVGSQYTPAAGWAQAIHYRSQVLHEEDWEGAMAVATGGEGSTAANGFWAALNIVTTLRLPYLFFIEDNGFGISVPGAMQTPQGDIAANLSAYANLFVMEGSGVDPQETFGLIHTAINRIRSGEGPGLLRLRVPRLSGHTFIDDQSYKSPELRAEEAQNDPLCKLYDYLLENGLSEADWQEMEQKAQSELTVALETAISNPAPNPEEALHYVFSEGILPIQGGLKVEKVNLPECSQVPQPDGPRINLVDAVRRTLESEMHHNPRILVFGEDVGRKGGVHGATLDMQAHFGLERVFDTSLSEEGIIGRSTGLALAGLLPVPEIQFRKYADPAHEQITDLGTLRWRTANKFAAPVVVRMPVGFSKKTGDPWHSMTAESAYAHLNGWRIAFPSNAEDAVGLLRSALRGDDPTFFFEHRALLDTAEARRPYPGDDYCLPFGKAAVRTEGNELTLITWGAMVQRCQQVAAEYPGRVEVIDLRTIIPWDREAVLASIHKTGKALIVHEDTLTTGFAAEIIAVINQEAFQDLDGPVLRLTMPDLPIPYSVPAMEGLLPNQNSIQEKVDWLLGF